MSTDLWQHQQEMIKFALPRHGVMWAAEMGTGKTRGAIELMRALEWPKTLIVAPAAVVRGVWPHQLALWGDPGLKIGFADGAVPPERRRTNALYNDILLANYESVWRKPLADTLFKAGFKLLILDESHRIKAAGGVTSRFVSRLSDRIEKRLALTGTPMPHSPMDIYAQYRALDKRIYGTSAALFRARYAIMGGFNGREIVAWQREDELRTRFESIAYQVKASDVLSLPPYVDSMHYVTLGNEAIRLSQQAEESFFLEVEQGVVTVANALVKLLRMQQITSGFLKPDDADKNVLFDTGKRDALASILADLGESHVVVFCRFRQDIEAIRDAGTAIGYNVFEVSGERKEQDDWRALGGVLATQIQSGGLGLDLTAARTAIYYSLGYSLGDYLQSRARLHRPGQERSVNYVHLVASGTIDARVMGALKKREQVVENIIGRGREQDGKSA